ncbi:MAG: hypothetical protein DSZ29_06625 [Aquificaceae bacterium]|nr:MAG: hypothetical protein DSZ29_06625 [Aquificaceae bacterium]
MPEQNRNTLRLNRRGNPIANNPLMRRGGVHKKSRTAKRQKHKRETRQLVTKYMTSYSRGRIHSNQTQQNSFSSKDHSMWSFFWLRINTTISFIFKAQYVILRPQSGCSAAW